MPRPQLDRGLFRSRTVDAAEPGLLRARRIENSFAAQLRKLAAQVGQLINGFDLTDPHGQADMAVTLARYGQAIEPWARSLTGRVLAELESRERTTWRALSAQMGRALRQELDAAPTGRAVREAQERQVGLIKSLPLEAAQRAQSLALEARISSARSSEVARMIAESGEVTAARANVIARTEISRAATELTRARAESIGSEGYTWRTSRNSSVRPSHRAMEGKFVRWDNPPELDGMTGHAGCLPNCRCIPIPIIPDV